MTTVSTPWLMEQESDSFSSSNIAHSTTFHPECRLSIHWVASTAVNDYHHNVVAVDLVILHEFGRLQDIVDTTKVCMKRSMQT